MDFRTADELLALCRGEHRAISGVMQLREQELFGVSPEAFRARMGHSLDIMRNAVDRAMREELTSMGGLVGGEARLLVRHAQVGVTACGRIMATALRYALGVMEVNASMGLIVAAPTAGSSGVIPGVLLSLADHYELERDKLINALFTAGAVGYLITRNATVSGAEGGCQAEVGSAAAMAAAAAVELLGGAPEASLAAAGIALTNMLGLVCDPIGGLVEVPCQKRNGAGVSNAMVAAEMALAGLRNHIPLDEVIAVMYAVGKGLPDELRETAMGGVAATPTACQLCGGGPGS